MGACGIPSIGATVPAVHVRPIKLFIYHPYRLARAGMRSVLAEVTRVGGIAEGSPPRPLARWLRDYDADVVLLGLATAADLDTVRMVRAGRVRVGSGRDVPGIVVIGQDHQQAAAIAAVEAGARGFLSLDATPEELVRVVLAVADGGAALCPCGVQALVDAHVGQQPAAVPAPPPPAAPRPASIATLSRRERQVLHLLAQGGSSAEIARQLAITETTVRSHIHHLLGKLGLRSRAQAIAFAFQHGIEPRVASSGGPAVRLDLRRDASHRRRIEHCPQRQPGPQVAADPGHDLSHQQ